MFVKEPFDCCYGAEGGENLLLTTEDNIKLADFGLAFSLQVNHLSMTASDGAATDECGTLLYTAPEVLLGVRYGRGADIWSLACTLVEMLTCNPPHQNILSEYARKKDIGAMESFRRRMSSTQPSDQLEYSGTLLTPTASEEIRLLLDCLFTKEREHRPKIDDILNLFSNTDADTEVSIDLQKVLSLKKEISMNLSNYSKN
uniref:Protein kinase domain-containing protein n=1 Tax=Plectus sambesii TaxID=2011161 RepID=A0A914WEQ3_9BILA